MLEIKKENLTNNWEHIENTIYYWIKINYENKLKGCYEKKLTELGSVCLDNPYRSYFSSDCEIDVHRTDKKKIALEKKNNPDAYWITDENGVITERMKGNLGKTENMQLNSKNIWEKC